MVYYYLENFKVHTFQRTLWEVLLLFTQWDISRPWKMFPCDMCHGVEQAELRSGTECPKLCVTSFKLSAGAPPPALSLPLPGGTLV